jgi:hypothetical protein
MKNNVVKFKDAKLTSDEKSDLEELGLNSFVTEYKRLRKKVVSDDFSSKEAAYQLTRAQLATVIRAISIADKAFTDSNGRNAYGYVAVHTLARELMHDLLNHGDQTEIISRIRNEIVQPLLSEIATKIVSSLIDSRKKLNIQLNDRDAKNINNELKKIQESITNIFVNAESNATEKLSNILNSKI